MSLARLPKNVGLLTLLFALGCSLAVPRAARADGEPAGPLELDTFYFHNYMVDQQTVVPVGQLFRVEWMVDGGRTAADLMLSWTGDDTVWTSTRPWGWYGASFDVQTEVPGTHYVYAQADYRWVHHVANNLACTNTEEAHFVRATNTWQVVAVTGITNSTLRVIPGLTLAFLTAQMTPVDAGQFVTWTKSGGTLSTNQGLDTQFTATDAGEFTATATCGSSSANYTIRIAGVTSVTGPDLVAVGDDVVYEATICYGPAQLPLIWNAEDGTVVSQSDTSATIHFNAPGANKLVTVQLGNTTAATQTTAVQLAGTGSGGGGDGGGDGGGGSGGGGSGGGAGGTPAVEYQVPGTSTWLPWTGVIYLPLNTTLTVKANPNPGPNFPAGYPKWTGLVTNTGAATISINFSQLSTNATDYKIQNVNCGVAVQCKAVVYEFNRYYEPDHKFTNRTTNIFGVGEVLMLKANISPSDLNPLVLGTWQWTVYDEGIGEGEFDTPNAPATKYFGPGRSSGVGGYAFALEHVPASLLGSAPLARGFTLVFKDPTIKLVPYLVKPTTGEDCVGHKRNFWFIEMYAKVRITPDDVSWRYVKIREIGGQTMEVDRPNGFFEVFRNLPHEAALVPIRAKRYAEGWRTEIPDYIWMSQLLPGLNYASHTGQVFVCPDFSVSWAAWKDIPWAFQVQRDGVGLEEWVSRAFLTKFTCDMEGTSGVGKEFEGGAAVTRASDLPFNTVKTPDDDAILDIVSYSP